MAGNYGTVITLDTLRAIEGTTVLQFGEDRIFDAVQAEIDIVNTQLNQALTTFVEPTTDRLRRGYGAQQDMEMVEVDEMGTPEVQKYVPTQQNLGFPLRRKMIALQWTRTAFDRMTPRELALQVDSALKADRKNIYRDIKQALFSSTNYSFTDRWVDHISLPVKALANADSFSLPFGPNGEVFNAATHNHYLATASLVAGDISALWKTVAEHYNSGQLMIYINQAQEAAVRAMTGNFIPYTPVNIINPTTATQAQGTTQPFNQYNRAIGLFDQVAEVWIKPWIPAGYMLCFNTGARKPLALRRSDLGTSDFQLVYEDENHRLRARNFQREFGLGVQERTSAAVLYIGGGAYVIPTIP